MSNKFSLMISIFFIFIAFVFGTDLVVIQNIYSTLDSYSLVANNLISKNGYISEDLKTKFIETYKVNIYPVSENNDDKSYKEGFIYGYYLEKDYKPIVLTNKQMKIKVKRFTLIG